MSAIAENREAVAEAEFALLGILLYDNAAADQIGDLAPEQFAEPFHSRLFAEILACRRREERADPITMTAKFGRDPAFAEFGGTGFLADLVDRSPPAQYAVDYAREVVDAWMRRRAVEMAGKLSVAALSNRETITKVLADAEQDIHALAQGAAVPEKSMVSAPDAVAIRLEQMAEAVAHGRPRGAQTGLRCFDRRMGGLQPGWLVTIGGRPSMGKSALMRCAAFGCARHNPDSKVIIFSMEMPKEELIDRALSELSDADEIGIPYFLMAQGKIGGLDLQRLAALRDRIPGNIIIDDTPALPLEEVRRRTWAIRRKHRVAAVFVDYLQKMPLRHGSGRNDAALYGEITGGLHQLSRSAETCVVLLSQLNRQVEHRDDKRPGLADLRESGSIEADSNAVFFPYREAYYLERAEPPAGSTKHIEWEQSLEAVKRRLEVICAKTRQGPIGSDVQVYFAEYDKIMDEGARA